MSLFVESINRKVTTFPESLTNEDVTELQIYHNYIREHSGLDGKTPAEACGITIEGKNKWKTLIQNATKFKKI
jgi:hypothetical protein